MDETDRAGWTRGGWAPSQPKRPERRETRTGTPATWPGSRTVELVKQRQKTTDDRLATATARGRETQRDGQPSWTGPNLIPLSESEICGTSQEAEVRCTLSCGWPVCFSERTVCFTASRDNGTTTVAGKPIKAQSFVPMSRRQYLCSSRSMATSSSRHRPSLLRTLCHLPSVQAHHRDS
jgi:hypothetical protein